MPRLFSASKYFTIAGLVAASTGAAAANTALIQSALTNQKRVYFSEPGVYYVNATLVAASGTIIDSLPGVSLKAVPGLNAPVLVNTGYLTLGAGGVNGDVPIDLGLYAGDYDIRVYNIEFDGDFANQTTAYSTVQFVKVSGFLFEGCTFKGGLRTGTFPTVSSHGDGLALTYCGLKLSNGKWGGKVSNCWAANNNYDGFKTRGAEDIQFSNVHALNNGRCGLQISYVYDKTHPSRRIQVNGLFVTHDTGTPSLAAPCTSALYVHASIGCTVTNVNGVGTQQGIGLIQGSTDNVFSNLFLQPRYDATAKAAIDIESGDTACLRNFFHVFHLRPLSGAAPKLIRVQAGSDSTKNNFNMFRGGYGSVGSGTGTPTVEIEAGCLQTKFSDIYWVSYALTNNGTDTVESNVMTASNSGTSAPLLVSGNIVLPDFPNQIAAGGALTTNSIRLIAWHQKVPGKFSTFHGRITTLHAANNIQGAIYGHNYATGQPTGNAIASTGNISTASTGLVSAAASGGDFTLAPGIYWMAVNSSGATAIMLTANTSGPMPGVTLLGSSAAADVLNAAPITPLIKTVAQAFGTWPDLTSATIVNANSISSGVFALQVA